MNLTAFLRLFFRNWWVVALVLVAGAASVVYFTAQQPRMYETSTSLVVRPSGSIAEKDDVIGSLNTLDRRTVVATVAKIPSSMMVRNQAWTQLNPPGQNQEDFVVRTTILPDTNILRISVEGPDPNIAAGFANSIATQAQGAIGRFYDMYQLSILDPATPSSDASSPSLKRNMSAGILISLFVGILVVLLMDYFQRGSIRVLNTENSKGENPEKNTEAVS